MTKTNIIFATLGLLLMAWIGYFFAHYTLGFRTPVKFQNPILVNHRTVKIVNVVQADEHNSPLTPDQQYACDLFGQAPIIKGHTPCQIAIGIMRAESHDKHDAYHINKNNSVDLGCWQLNTVHLSQIDTSKLNLLNCQDNTKAAYIIYKQSGFNPWVTFQTDEYSKYLY